ncbi:MAG TPA: DUF6614 family protein [Fimbriimonadaceae bacterium]|nr:DUF6614 family protein [Fimbriimonadaceae bacterium]
MDYYEIWVNLVPGTNDMEFSRCVRAYLDHLVAQGDMDSYTFRRRKLGFGPDGLGEFNVTLKFRSLAHIDEAFFDVAKRSGETEKLHHEVYSKVKDFKAGLYRDYPDPVREE